MLTGLAALAIATLACAFVPSLPWLGGLRVTQGLAAASFAPVALAYLIEATPPRLRATAIGAMSTAFLVAGIFGQVLAGWIALHGHWSWVFLVTGGALAIMTPLIALFAREPGRAALHGHLGHRFAAMARLLARPAILLLSCAHITLLLSFVAMYTALGPHLQTLGLDGGRVLLLRLAGLPLMFMALLAGPLAARIRMSGVACTGFMLAATGVALEAALSQHLPGIVAGSLIFVTGVALAIPAMIVLYGTLAAPDRAAGMALNGFVLFIGASIGPVLAGRVADFRLLLMGLAVVLLGAAGCMVGSGRLTGKQQKAHA
nr:MAG: MFS transporter [Lautropia sp.]